MRAFLSFLTLLFVAPVLYLPAQTPASAGAAEQRPSALYRQGIDDLMNKHAYRIQFRAGSQWLDGSDRYTALEPSATDPNQSDLVAYVTATGKRSVLVPAKSFVPPGAMAQLDIDDYTWSADKQQLLLFANTQKVWRLHTRGDYWVLNVPDGKLRKLGADSPAASLMFAKFSPDGKSVGYVPREQSLRGERSLGGTQTDHKRWFRRPSERHHRLGDGRRAVSAGRLPLESGLTVHRLPAVQPGRRGRLHTAE